MENYYHNIQKLDEDETSCKYSYTFKGQEKIITVEGEPRHLIDALGNALLKESFQKFEI